MQVKPHSLSTYHYNSLIFENPESSLYRKANTLFETLSNNHLKLLYITAIYSLSVTAKPSATVIAARATGTCAAHVATTEAT